MLELGSGNGLVVSTLLKSVVSTRDHIIATDLPEVSIAFCDNKTMLISDTKGMSAAAGKYFFTAYASGYISCTLCYSRAFVMGEL